MLQVPKGIAYVAYAKVSNNTKAYSTNDNFF